MSKLLVESRQGRRIIGRLASGEDLVEGLLAIFQANQVRSASFQASGVLQEVALAHYDHAKRSLGKSRWFRTPLQILSAAGVLSEREGKPDLRLNLVLSRQGDNGIEVLGGIATAARVIVFEFVVDVMDDVMLRRGIDRQTGLQVWQQLLGAHSGVQTRPADQAAEIEVAVSDENEPEVVAQAAEKSSLGDAVSRLEESGNGGNNSAGWAEAVAVSMQAQSEQRHQQEVEPMDYRAVQIGDFLDHAKFGRCVVERLDVHEEFATVRLRNNRLVRLNIEVLNLSYQGDENGHQVFATAKS